MPDGSRPSPGPTRRLPSVRAGARVLPHHGSAPRAGREEARMSIPVRIGVVALLSLLSFLLPPAVPGAAPPAARCVGDDACTGNTGTVGPGSCIGLDACLGNTGNINKNACRPVAGQNPLDAIAVCETNQGDVGEGACRQQTACVANA